ncbi:MAG: DNA polymerase IV [Lachnospiraceae bacterium]|nr:DNA polymerase IV [Lachnospiraceae bacterium]
MNLIFHIDVNSAYLSWSAMERLKEDPSLDLRTVPSIIGGDEKSRHGVVLAKSIPAKKYGVRTGEPVASALRKCPTLLMEPPDHKLYSRRSRELMDLLHSYTSDIEQVSIDECYMAYTPISHQFSSPQHAARLIADRIRHELGFTVNIGIAPNKLLAKMASDFEKPDKIHTLFPEEIPQKMWPLPVEDLFMVGRSSAQRLTQLGIRTIGELAHTDPEFLQLHFKSHGQMMWEYANGIDISPMNMDSHELKGIGNSTTLSSDAKTASEAKKVLLALSEQVASRLRRSHQIAQTVTVEIKYNTFQSCSRQTQLSSPSAASGILYEYACRLFDELWNGTPIRLLGLRTSKLLPEDAPVQLSLFDTGLLPVEEPSAQTSAQTGFSEAKQLNSEKQKRLDQAMDQIRRKFGQDAVVRGAFLKRKDEPNSSDLA